MDVVSPGIGVTIRIWALTKPGDKISKNVLLKKQDLTYFKKNYVSSFGLFVYLSFLILVKSTSNSIFLLSNFIGKL